ncbi:DUF1249 domain-containing protein [Microbulbifer thermotolerans]|uniref:DUF1249 domain-containing protein n=1 Tax=Microbulbifer thermotolerans TaxID=252514 RepID=UPI0008E7FC20|nr:DUF1249 domain-containing protein [Microbulbifer thermotolerans]MCX2781088.1 DUF1249 domain-containing protein [Microbulbifer thermotolerans]MCX2804481.1 DUF1249 domain-containing protein [Microbulbifer thermotolerans]MCX2841304.1 DUF1249 domain-containing protein [Microbulbifer thermotolerans]WKT60124.1 DUF1249 domain-containing protein [Microbulbifer thermotolerans]SFD03991.1 hypothetical protein SAMN05660479_03005 [Microbulbifer thermotolerans]
MALLTETGTVAEQKAKLSLKGKKKPAYRVNLPAYHADCDANYLRLCKLLPELDSRERWRYRMPHGTVELLVLERSRYTTEVCLSAEAVAGDRRWIAPPNITVRLYHDARMAEVIAIDGHGPVGGTGVDHVYPNPRMQRADERQQVNRFLGEWLGHCLANGRAEFELVLDGRRF